MKKIKVNKQIIWITFGIILTFGLILFIIIFKSLYSFKPIFYSFSGYADSTTINNINKKYSYKEYSSATEFEYMMENNKTIGGVASDYSIISLINQNKIAPLRLDLQKIINPNDNELSSEKWEEYFSDESIDQMNQYQISEDVQKKLRQQYYEYGTNYNFKFSDFVVPYLINDKVIAINTKKILNEINMSKNPLNFKNEYPTIIDAFQKINQEEKNDNLKIQWTKNERENVVIGSTKGDPKLKWDTKITNDNYLELLNNFEEIVREGTGFPMNDVKRNLFDSDSDIVLNNLINPSSKINVTTIYNGDALDAYYGSDNFKEITDGDRVRIIRTKYTVRVLDCFVISSSISKEQKIDVLKDFNEMMFNGMFKTEKELIEIDHENFSTEGIIRIFDYVNYTPAARGPFYYIFNNYFKNDDGSHDEIARDIYKVAKTDEQKGIYVKGLPLIEKDVLSKLTLAFQRKINGY